MKEESGWKKGWPACRGVGFVWRVRVGGLPGGAGALVARFGRQGSCRQGYSAGMSLGGAGNRASTQRAAQEGRQVGLVGCGAQAPVVAPAGEETSERVTG